MAIHEVRASGLGYLAFATELLSAVAWRTRTRAYGKPPICMVVANAAALGRGRAALLGR